jgi:hypothetical protein
VCLVFFFTGTGSSTGKEKIGRPIKAQTREVTKQTLPQPPTQKNSHSLIPLPYPPPLPGDSVAARRLTAAPPRLASPLERLAGK